MILELGSGPTVNGSSAIAKKPNKVADLFVMSDSAIFRAVGFLLEAAPQPQPTGDCGFRSVDGGNGAEEEMAVGCGLRLGGEEMEKRSVGFSRWTRENGGDRGADHGLVQKDNQSTSLSSTLHVPLQSGMHPSSNVSGCNDVLMEQIPNPPIPDGLVISDPKRKRSELDGPQSILPPTAPNPKDCFRFENLWLREAHCRDIMIASWSKTHGQCLMDRVGSCGKAIWIWGRHFGRNFQRRLDYWRRRMENTKYRHDPTGISLFKEAQTEYLRVLQQQNTYWRQRAKQFWLKDGDSNTAFFHKAVKRRHQSNRIMKLRDNNGLWIERANMIRRLSIIRKA
nr:uncharacterized protein LOC109167502 [Ipomoea batatas]